MNNLVTKLQWRRLGGILRNSFEIACTQFTAASVVEDRLMSQWLSSISIGKMIDRQWSGALGRWRIHWDHVGIVSLTARRLWLKICHRGQVIAVRLLSSNVDIGHLTVSDTTAICSKYCCHGRCQASSQSFECQRSFSIPENSKRLKKRFVNTPQFNDNRGTHT